MIAVTHVGPSLSSFGGTQAVIRVIRDNKIGADDIRVISTWNERRHLRNTVLTVRAAVALALTPRSRIAHFHISSGGAWLREGPLIYLAKARGLRVVITIHGFDFVEFASAHARLVGGILRRADHVILLSEEACEIATKLASGVPTSILANPIVIDREAPGASTTAPVALFAGTVGLRKGVDVLVAAWQILLAEGIDGHCRVVGPIDDYTPPPLEGFSVEPPVPPDEVPNLIRSVRLVVLPSRAEGMPLIVAEGLAGARPAVATPVAGTPTIVPDPDMLVPVGDPEALAAAIGRYLRDPDLAERDGLKGQAHIEATRSPAVISERLRRIYEECGVAAS